MIVFMDIRLVRVHLPQSLCWRLGSVGKEGPQIVVLLSYIGLRGNEIAFALPPLVLSTKLCKPSHYISVGCLEGNGLISPLLIYRINEMLLLYQEVKDLASSNSLAIHSSAANKISHCNLHPLGTRDTTLLCRGIPGSLPPSLASLIYLPLMQVPPNDLAVGIMSNMKKIANDVANPGFLDVLAALLSNSVNHLEMIFCI
jgi:hypothetical protein